MLGSGSKTPPSVDSRDDSKLCSHNLHRSTLETILNYVLPISLFDVRYDEILIRILILIKSGTGER